MSEPKRQFGTYPNGRLQTEWFEIDGKTHGIWRKWHPNGQLALESPYTNGLEDGTTRIWDESGKLIDSYTMVQGTGIRKVFGPEPGKRTQIAMRDGTRFGPTTVFAADGNELSTEYFVMSQKIPKALFEIMAAIGEAGRAASRGERDPSKPYFPPEILEKVRVLQEQFGSPDDPARITALADEILHAPPPTKSQLAEAQKADEQCLELLAKPNAHEARTWLAAAARGQQRIIGQRRSAEESRTLIELWYSESPEPGEMLITLVDVYESEDFARTERIVVTLPDRANPAFAIARARLLARCSRQSESEGFDPVTDIGQKYQFVWFD